MGAIAAGLVTLALTVRAFRYRVISPWLGAAGILILGGAIIATALHIGDPAQGLRGGDGIVLLVSATCALMWFKQDVEGRIRVKHADAKIAAADLSAKAQAP